MKQKTVCFFIVTGFYLLLIAFWSPNRKHSGEGVAYTLDYVKGQMAMFAGFTRKLHEDMLLLSPEDSTSLENVKTSLVKCRLSYKRIEFFLTYFFPGASDVYNLAPVVEVEEPTLDFREPMGMQQIEALLFAEDPYSRRQELLIQTEALSGSAGDLPSLLYRFDATDQQLLESIRLQLIRIMALSITGYDAPELKTGVPEAREALYSVKYLADFYLARHPQPPLSKLVDAALQYLERHSDFDTFDRIFFLKRYAIPVQDALFTFVVSNGFQLNTSAILNEQVSNLFKPGALRVWGEDGTQKKQLELIGLGKKLFNENAISGNNARSCASCHNPALYFTDGLSRSVAINGHSPLKRNAPTLLYAGFQQAQLWDGRSASLSEQIKKVISDKEEMNADTLELLQKLAGIGYKGLFRKAFPTLERKAGLEEMTLAIEAYVNSLAPMNSPFDRYMAGREDAMTPAQLKGFNLFMGKAKCGTCHFMPLFNALLPPYYQISEYEIIGTTRTDDLLSPVRDEDEGRYELYAVPYYKRAFKTPTVRNAEKTAPYMHNGAFRTLASVVEFYNQGGGHGLHLNDEMQTLSSGPLNLTEQEKKDLVEFINALTDVLPREDLTDKT